MPLPKQIYRLKLMKNHLVAVLQENYGLLLRSNGVANKGKGCPAKKDEKPFGSCLTKELWSLAK